MKTDKVVSGVLGEEMTISPSEVLNQRFSKALTGGYAQKEVDAFLERVADVLEDLIVQVRVLKTKTEEQASQVDSYREMEDALRNALISSQKLGEEIIENAKREAHAILHEAELTRAQAELEAARIPLALTEDIRLLLDQRTRFRAEIEAILETHARLLDSLIPKEALRYKRARGAPDEAPATEAEAALAAGQPATGAQESDTGEAGPAGGPERSQDEEAPEE